MATATQTITASQNPWVPPADFDINQPISIAFTTRGGAGSDNAGDHGGQGGSYAKWNSVVITNASQCSIAIGNGFVVFTNEVGDIRKILDGADGGAGGTGGGTDSSDIAPDILNLGGNGGSVGTTGGGGGGEAGSASAAGNNGSDGSVAVGGAGGTGTAGANGGAGGNATVNGVAGTAPGGGGGGGGSVATGGAGGAAQVQIVYTVVAEPTVQATNTVGSAIQPTVMTLACTPGNGDKRVCFVKAASSGTPVPVDDTTYTANTVFGSGTQIGSTGWYCVYSGTGSSVSITGLVANTTYRAMWCEFNEVAATKNYNGNTDTGNPANVATGVVGPYLSAATNAAGTKISVSFRLTDVSPTAWGTLTTNTSTASATVLRANVTLGPYVLTEASKSAATRDMTVVYDVAGIVLQQGDLPKVSVAAASFSDSNGNASGAAVSENVSDSPSLAGNTGTGSKMMLGLI